MLFHSNAFLVVFLPIVWLGFVALARLRARFAAWTRGHGVKLVATWPNIRRFDAYQSPVADRFFSDVRQFYRKLAVPVIGSPHDAMFEADAFYDTIYHLHRSAVERRTTRLLPHLLDQLGSGSGVSGPLSGSVGSAT